MEGCQNVDDIIPVFDPYKRSLEKKKIGRENMRTSGLQLQGADKTLDSMKGRQGD